MIGTNVHTLTRQRALMVSEVWPFHYTVQTFAHRVRHWLRRFARVSGHA